MRRHPSAGSRRTWRKRELKRRVEAQRPTIVQETMSMRPAPGAAAGGGGGGGAEVEEVVPPTGEGGGGGGHTWLFKFATTLSLSARRRLERAASAIILFECLPPSPAAPPLRPGPPQRFAAPLSTSSPSAAATQTTAPRHACRTTTPRFSSPTPVRAPCCAAAVVSQRLQQRPLLALKGRQVAAAAARARGGGAGPRPLGKKRAWRLAAKPDALRLHPSPQV